nr:hypothetical protein [Streptomyces sp. SID3343]
MEHLLSGRRDHPAPGPGHDIKDEDVARLSPLKDRHANFLGRYRFSFRDDG